MYYKINVSRLGKHVFATAEQSAQTEPQAKRLYDIIKKKFPEDEGYLVEVSRWESFGKIINFEEE